MGRGKRRVAALAAGTETRSQGRGASLRTVGNGNSRGPDNCSVDATPLRFGEGGGALLPPLVDCRIPVDGDGLYHGDKWQSTNRSL